MKHLKTLAALALSLSATLGAGLAQAHSDVRWSVSIGVPAPVYVQPAPVYAPPPVIYAPPPRPVYVPAPVVYGPPPGYYDRAPTRWDRDADGIPDRYERHHRRWDSDRDGTPDRWDRRPHDPWRR